jgi:hypothetical protein
MMESIDQARFDYAGGYPSDWKLVGELLLIATVGGSGSDEPELEIHLAREWLAEQEEMRRE